MNSKIHRTLAIVDDDVELHDLITAYFKPKGFTVYCYLNPLDAITDSLTIGKDWDILLTNFHFSNMKAAEFSRLINDVLPMLPIILIAPVDQTATAIEAIQNGAYDFIAKPIHFGQLQVSVQRALDMRTLATANSELRQMVRASSVKPSNLVGRSPKFLAAIDIADRVAKSSASILLTGESGTGKEVFAQYIHTHSKFSGGPFTAINCSSIPETLLESELFGHAKGSFTGAIEKRIGLFEAAEKGTLFLDEIGDLSLQLQAKLLRVLQEKKIKRVGENVERSINCRIISATHKNLEKEIVEGRFRDDLFFRLNVIPITIPPLRDRPEDLMLLAELFLRRFALANESPAKTFSKEAIKYLMTHKWQGNVRELENTIERAVVLCSDREISIDNFIPSTKSADDNHGRSSEKSAAENGFHYPHLNQLPSLDQVIDRYIAYAVYKNGGARDKAAKEIGIDRKTLYRRMKTHDVNEFHPPETVN